MNHLENREMLDQAMLQLAGHGPFQVYMESLRAAREACIADLCNDAVIANDRLTLAAIGEIRTYQSVLDSYEQAKGRISAEH